MKFLRSTHPVLTDESEPLSFRKQAATAIALAEAIKQNTTLRLIDLSHNKIGEEGIVALVEAIKQNATIELVVLEGIDLTEKGAVAINEV